MAVSNPWLCWVFLHAGAERFSGELCRMIWYAVIHFIHHLDITVSYQPLCGSIYNMDISLDLPAVTLAKLNPDILNTYILERTYINWIYIWTRLLFVIICLEFAVSCKHHLQLLPLTLRRIIVAEWTMIWYSSGGILLTLYALCMGYISQLLQLLRLLRSLPTATSTNCYYNRRFFSILWWTRSSVLPLRSLESVVRGSSAVLYTLDLISRYFYAGLDRYSQIRHSRWMLLMFSDLSHSPDLIISQTRHLRRILLSLTNSSAGSGLYPTRGVCGAALKPLTVRCKTPGC